RWASNRAKDRSLRQLLQGNAIPVGAAEGCDLLILFFRIKIKRSQRTAAPTKIMRTKNRP
ncbi:hypothetical protein SOP94_27005, partial [Peribacillus frigoritolerans]